MIVSKLPLPPHSEQSKMAAPTKQYGLILSQKKGGLKAAALQKPSVFGDDSDDETSVGESLKREAIKKKMMKQTRLEMQKALEEDSTVYDYDAVYDDIQKQRSETTKKLLGGADKKPRYIHQLLKAVDERKKDQERREERKIQKERVAEGEKFSDKDAYVTSAYKQKLLEQKEEQEREDRQSAIEAALDVKKQRDLTGFYRHLLNQTVGEEEIPDRSANKPQTVMVKTEKTSPLPSPTSHDNNASSCSDSEEAHEQKSAFSKLGAGSTHPKRQYRQRSPSSGSGEDKEKEKERERDRHKKSHRDQDRGRDRDRDRDRNRGKERDDRHGGRRDDRDRRKDRERGREDDRSRGRGDAEREDRHGKRAKSPKDRERDKNGDREKRRNPAEDERKDKDREQEKERRKEQEKEKTVKKEEKEPEKKEEDGGEEVKEKEVKEEIEEKESKFAKRSTDHTLSSARERYMARQMGRSGCKSYIEKEED